ncbi:type II toxin-antitoxin system prevent-host-death family antitoxin [Streptomyces sp. NPDC047315]|uniref:type II toxin-antitoxin system prevent-host-death family antitoxin n=1 Tax=Streptomyces sp. NPDC047315 TaxID=3155142 RepID=UPI0033D105F4
MAADQGIQTADDGVAEVSMTDARANLTQLLRDVRYGGRPAAFTERGRRSAYVVPTDFYEQAVEDRLTAEAVRLLIDETAIEQTRENLMADLARYREGLKREA